MQMFKNATMHADVSKWQQIVPEKGIGEEDRGTRTRCARSREKMKQDMHFAEGLLQRRTQTMASLVSDDSPTICPTLLTSRLTLLSVHEA